MATLIDHIYTNTPEKLMNLAKEFAHFKKNANARGLAQGGGGGGALLELTDALHLPRHWPWSTTLTLTFNQIPRGVVGWRGQHFFL